MMIQLKVGDEVYTGPLRGRGGHGAHIVITKINRKSIKGVEKNGSYRSGMEWTLGKDVELAKVTYDGERVDPEKGLITGLMRTTWRRLSENGILEF